LKFIGNKSADEVEKIKLSLGRIQAGGFDVSFRGYGFFPTSNSPRVFWLGVAGGSPLGTLAKSVDQNVAELGIPEEEHAFSPHLTLARRGSGASRRLKSDVPNSSFQQLQKRLSAMAAPDFGTMTAREFFLYESQPARGGSRYTKIARFELT
jgi:2'-5' RNA ligase